MGLLAQARSLRSAVGDDEDQPPPVPAADPVPQEDPHTVVARWVAEALAESPYAVP